MKIDPNAPAYPFGVNVPPITELGGVSGPVHQPGYTIWHPGLTIRAHFAAMAMAAMISRETRPDSDKVAEKAVKYADLLIEELNK